MKAFDTIIAESAGSIAGPWLLLRGPLLAGEDYQTEREVVALSGSRRTESLWARTTVFASEGSPAATMRLNPASIKDSCSPYSREYKELYA